jgi:hypothetical protein
MRQFRRLQRIRLKTSAARTVPENFMRRMIRANQECPWAERSAGSRVVRDTARRRLYVRSRDFHHDAGRANRHRRLGWRLQTGDSPVMGTCVASRNT